VPITSRVTSAPEAGWVGRAGWLPYLAPAVVLGLAMYAQFGGSLFDRVSLAVAGALISLLVLARQFFASQDLLSAQGKLSYQAFHDALTGLPNRPLFLDRLERALVQSEGGGRGVTVMMLDLDKFKLVNDTLGHAAGDELLQALAEVLPRAIRPSDTVARFGGNEFAFLIDGIQGEQAIVTIAKRILAAVAEPFLLNGRRPQVRGTLGIGYSSLRSLQRFPFSNVKIDRSFTRAITDPSSKAPITDAITKLAHTLGMQAIAEGVETPIQADYLRNLGCDAAQGFHFARPQPASDITARLQDQQQLDTRNRNAALRVAAA
jgi:diguanylate cyclase (GGDEF)-like protein